VRTVSDSLSGNGRLPEADNRRAVRELLTLLRAPGARSACLVGLADDTAWGLDVRQECELWCAEQDAPPVLARCRSSAPRRNWPGPPGGLEHPAGIDAVKRFGPPPGPNAPLRIWISDLPTDTPLKILVRHATSRWSIECGSMDMESLLGLGEYEGRTWDGFHHHQAILVSAARLFSLDRTWGA